MVTDKKKHILKNKHLCDLDQMFLWLPVFLDYKYTPGNVTPVHNSIIFDNHMF